MARAAAAAGVPMVVSSNAGSTVRGHRGDGRRLVAADLRHRRPARATPCPSSSAAVAAGAAAVVLTADTPVRRHALPVAGGRARLGHGRSDLAATPTCRPPAGWRRRTGQGDRPRPGTTSPGWPSRPGSPSWSRESCAPTTPGLRRMPGRRRCGSPTTAAASSTRPSRPPACVAAVRGGRARAGQVYVDGGVRSGLHVLLAVGAGRRCCVRRDGRCSTPSPREAQTVCARRWTSWAPSWWSRCVWPAVRRSRTRGRSLLPTSRAETRREAADLREPACDPAPLRADLTRARGAPNVSPRWPGSGGTQGREVGRPAPGRTTLKLTSSEVLRVRASAASGHARSRLLRGGWARRNGFDSEVPTR